MLPGTLDPPQMGSFSFTPASWGFRARQEAAWYVACDRTRLATWDRRKPSWGGA